MNKILYCPVCKKYTLEETCRCGEKTFAKKPPRYSPDDRMGSYRRKARKDDLIKRGML